MKFSQLILSVLLICTFTFNPLLAQDNKPKKLDDSKDTLWGSIDYKSKTINKGIKINDLNDYSFFLHGEVHYSAANPKIQLAFIKYYYQKAGVRNLVIEASYASSFLYNKYLESGDEKYLCSNSQLYCLLKEEREFWKRLYNYNKTLIEKIKIVGIDESTYIGVWYGAMETLFKGKVNDAAPEIKKVVKKLINYSESMKNPLDYSDVNINLNNTNILVHQFKDTVIQNYRNYLNKYELLLGDNFIHFKLIIENHGSFNRSKSTNKRMYQNLQQIIKAQQINVGNYFGQFGYAHVIGGLTTILNDEIDSPFKNKTLAIVPFYQNCKSFNFKRNPIDNHTVTVIPFDIKPIITLRKYGKQNTPYKYTLIERRKGKNTPYKYVLRIQNEDNQHCVIQFCD